MASLLSFFLSEIVTANIFSAYSLLHIVLFYAWVHLILFWGSKSHYLLTGEETETQKVTKVTWQVRHWPGPGLLDSRACPSHPEQLEFPFLQMWNYFNSFHHRDVVRIKWDTCKALALPLHTEVPCKWWLLSLFSPTCGLCSQGRLPREQGWTCPQTFPDMLCARL